MVVGIDGSETAQRALRWALDEARARNATLNVVHTWEIPQPGYDPHTTGLFNPALYMSRTARLIDEALTAKTPRASALRSSERQYASSAASAILDAHLLVLGSRGLGGFQRHAPRLGHTPSSSPRPCPQVVPPTPEHDR
jgi:nucleotide-binding universal stress UspA family protein